MRSGLPALRPGMPPAGFSRLDLCYWALSSGGLGKELACLPWEFQMMVVLSRLHVAKSESSGDQATSITLLLQQPTSSSRNVPSAFVYCCMHRHCVINS